MTTKRFITAALLPAATLAVGVLIGGGLWHPEHGAAVPTGAHKALYYQNSMHPWVKSDQPGKCTVCGMDLTPIYEGQTAQHLNDNCVMLSSNSVTVLNVESEEVKQQELTRSVQVAGTLEADETKKTIVAAPAAGRVDDLTVRFPGVEVSQGERLVAFYSPELTLEKRRFLVRARMSSQKDPTGGLAVPMSDSDPYYSDLVSPQSGTVVERKVYKGQYVSDGEKLFTIVDLSVLWFRFDVYENQLPWLALGQTIEVSVPAVPGKTFHAVISFIEPMLNELTRTVKVRAELQNPLVEVGGNKKRLLGLNMYAQGEVHAQLQPALAVARTAILQPGSQSYAYVDRGGGVYEKRCVKLGHQADSLWEVLQGLEPGERVVTSGNVLIDAQAQFDHSEAKVQLAGGEQQGGGAVALSAPGPIISSTAAAAGPIPEHEALNGSTMSGAGNPLAETRQKAPLALAGSAKATPTAKTTRNPRHPVHPAVSPANPGFRNTRLGGADEAMTAAFTRMAELRNNEMAERPAAKVAPTPLKASQAHDCQAILAASDAISRSLAEDNLQEFKLHLRALVEALVPVADDFPAPHPLSPIVQRLTQATSFTPAKDLADARSQLLSLGAAAADLARVLKGQDSSFAGLKVYHCPMAPKPGLWVQADGPLRNPFFGAKMLNCGEEVKPEERELAQGPVHLIR